MLDGLLNQFDADDVGGVLTKPHQIVGFAAQGHQHALAAQQLGRRVLLHVGVDVFAVKTNAAAFTLPGIEPKFCFHKAS
jgi:hypothetical protein